ncbi:hypothetical protein [Pelagovum pacificum]|uniref:DNA alkylation repair protein n=1 Tax=Pelagovum pacificum TaxID=2588711 RepID=A0A5C5GBA3_9RHOB|nr:hypothetical protein [Pelagovum pacificum]QQA41367.1 hypothetical protein I8N54_11050 [Pelagovum pacificum]TNY31830.1 hypothetical protein FHY64_00555 [Pelagovum pacificum]
MAEPFSLRDHLFNETRVRRLASLFGPAFDSEGFVRETVADFPDLQLKQRIARLADGLEVRLPQDFPAMAERIRDALPPPLDPTRTDDDFGEFIHAPFGVLIERHGMQHPDLALDLLEEVTQRFSMEFAIRPFLNRWPEETLSRMETWASHPNYHVRRLVSEGTRPRLPWGSKIDIDPLRPLPLLDRLHADPTRYVTRSVANHLNDITRRHPESVIGRLSDWAAEGRQDQAELRWMTAHALRGLVKAGHPGAIALLGYRTDADVTLSDLTLTPEEVRIGETAEIAFTLTATGEEPVIVDYKFDFLTPSGRVSPRHFKLIQTSLQPGKPRRLAKRHRFKGGATTFTLCPGAQRLRILVNGRELGTAILTLTL